MEELQYPCLRVRPNKYYNFRLLELADRTIVTRFTNFDTTFQKLSVVGIVASSIVTKWSKVY